MKRRVLRWYDYSWSRGRIQGGGDINTALGLLPDKLKTELALHVNLSVLKKVPIINCISNTSFWSFHFFLIRLFVGHNFSRMSTGISTRSRTQNESIHIYAGRFNLPQR